VIVVGSAAEKVKYKINSSTWCDDPTSALQSVERGVATLGTDMLVKTNNHEEELVDGEDVPSVR